MQLYERLEQALNKGYMPVQVPSENFFFFVEDNREFKIGEIIEDGLGKKYKISYVTDKQLMVTRETDEGW